MQTDEQVSPITIVHLLNLKPPGLSFSLFHGVVHLLMAGKVRGSTMQLVKDMER